MFYTLVTWAGSFAAWLLVSTFVHEVFHLITSLLIGFKVKRYRLVSMPGGTKGYVDVVIPQGINHYLLKRGLMHLSGPAAHLVMGIGAAVLLRFPGDLVLKGVWVAGIAVNLYLLLVNLWPEGSDGRQYWEMLRRQRNGRAAKN